MRFAHTKVNNNNNSVHIMKKQKKTHDNQRVNKSKTNNEKRKFAAHEIHIHTIYSDGYIHINIESKCVQ